MIPVSCRHLAEKLKHSVERASDPRAGRILPVCLSVIGTLLLPRFISDGTTAFSNSFAAIAYAAVLFMLFSGYYRRRHVRTELALTHVFGLLLSCMTAAGRSIEQTGSFFPVSPVTGIAVLFYTHVFGCVISFIWEKLSEQRHENPTPRSDSAGSRLSRLLSFVAARPWLVSVSLLLCWLPCYIAVFPGGFMYDVTAEFRQQYETYLSCFPRIHSALMIGCLNAAHRLTGSYNAGIAVYCAVQMAAFSAIFTHMLVIFYRQRVRGAMLLFLWLYFAVFPVIHLIITSIGRDTLFALLFVYLVTLLYDASCDAQGFMRSPWKPACLGAVLALTVLSRNNTNEKLIMLLLLAAVGAVWLRLHKVFPRGIAVFSVSCLTVFISLSFLLGAVCSPMTKANQGAALGLVTQTLVRAYTDEPEKWSDEDIADFARFVDAEHAEYCPELADVSREAMTEEAIKADIGGFLKLWVRMGVRCPDAYLNAAAAQTRYGWYPDSVIDGYVRGKIYDTEKSYFTTGVSSPGKKVHLWHWGEEFYRKLSWDISFEKIPIVSMLFSIGFQNWLALHCFFLAVYRRRRNLYLPLGVILAYLLICLFLPIVIMRYFMPLYLLFPLTAVMTLCPPRHDGQEAAERGVQGGGAV